MDVSPYVVEKVSTSIPAPSPSPTLTSNLNKGYDKIISPHSIGWGKMLSYQIDPSCLHPPPFGTQCTVPANESLRACDRVGPKCKAIICPDPSEYVPKVTPELARKGIQGPICLLRETIKQNELRHRMCRPGGCTIYIKKT
eukprot:PhF_6_TR3341/c0_g1_i1/m.4720